MVQTATAATAAPENPTAIFDTAIADAEWLLEKLQTLGRPQGAPLPLGPSQSSGRSVGKAQH